MSGEKHTLAYDDVTIHDPNEKTVYSRDETALSSGVSHDHNEKSVHLRDQTALSSGVKQDVPYDDVEHARKGSRRKSSVIAAIKDNYGLVDAPSSEASSLKAGVDYTHRKLKPRHIQLIGIGGTIGTALYVNIGRGLLNGGPASLFIAFSLWCSVIMMVTNCMSEMVTYLPISSPFIRFAGRWVDDAFGFAAGYNFFIFEAALVPFEIVACNVIIQFWTDSMPAGATIAIILVIYAAVNLFAVKWYGETEFWMALGKVLLIIGLLFYTFVVMLGGNPLGDRFGFRYWKNPGSFTTLYGYEGNLGRFVGFLQCLIQASFTIAGPDYVSMAAGEAENPRWVMPRAFRAVFYRLTTFFMLGSLAVGILVPYNDPDLREAYRTGAPGAAASPYVASMTRLRISVLPHIVNAMVLTSALSAGNSYVYCASRSLYGMALEGKAPKFMTRCTKNGVPIYCVVATLLIALLAFLQVSNNAAIVLQWFVSLVTASQLINFCCMCFTYLCFRRALAAQGISRDSLPHKSFWQPWGTYYAFIMCFIMAFVGGYTVFLPGFWTVPDFLFSYTMIAVFPILYLVWKVIHKTKIVKPEEADLKKDLDEIEEYTRNYVPTPPKNAFDKWFNKIFS
ncbi:general amino acid permease agp2 [Lithohypha guttulata]|uniref:General amino acid permease agp2 n=1 Tax=Lithohypha guttulata TaxID=1690604 RepID=A0AAN7T889_9EURO|nr:general amino acid permease agp2 [Lithohypha guttulata]KAK5091490.1 general amino acid permease agp2 [Lithohypha guttulata]